MGKYKIITALLILSLIPFQKALAFSRPEDHVVVTGDVFSRIRNVPVENIRVYTLKDGRLDPIPFQIDKVDIDGRFLFSQKEAEKKAGERKEAYEDALDDREDFTEQELEKLKNESQWVDNMSLFDAQDELVFMAWDLGQKAGPGILPGADSIEELIITNPTDSDRGYVYVALFKNSPPPVSEKNYIRYDAKRDYVDTDFYLVDFDEDNTFVFNEARNKDANGKCGPNYMDRMKMRFKMDIKWFFTLNFDETNANGKLITYKAGPVRIIKRTLFWIDILYIPVMPSVAMDFVFYTNGMVSPSILDVTYDPASTINEGSYLMFALDFSDSNNGSKVYTQKMKEPAIMDGVMSDAEKALDLKGQMWYVVYKEGETGYITQLVCDDGLKDVIWEIKYIDDKNELWKPEREPGQHLLGFYAEVKQFPKGKFKMNLFTYMNKNWKIGVEKRYLNFVTHPLQAKSVTIKTDSR